MTEVERLRDQIYDGLQILFESILETTTDMTGEEVSNASDSLKESLGL